ncbi:Uncharacterised protein [Enterobacter cloacae]|nr:Uncharacterised protein [Enterobacter cloacae]VAU69481.1 Uncharacterised protein [Klebsiella pneumoniae]
MIFQRLEIQFIGFKIRFGQRLDMQITIEKRLSGNLIDRKRKITAFKTGKVGA